MQNITLSNISSLTLTSKISTNTPFSIRVGDNNFSEILLEIKTGESKQLAINFDPSFKNDFHNETVNGVLTVNYIEHLHTVIILNYFFKNFFEEKLLSKFYS